MRKQSKLTLALLALTAAAFVAAAPAALRAALERGQLYIFTSQLFTDFPLRLSGPGRLRFILQPTIASILGIRDGLADLRHGRPAYLFALLSGAGSRRELLRGGLASVANLVLMAILLDTVSQWLIFGVAYPGAALIVGPILISAPYAITRALGNRIAAATRRG